AHRGRRRPRRRRRGRVRGGAPVMTDTGVVDLEIGGMTCASCAVRVEKKLNRLDGVTATVNFATEKARVSGANLDPEALIAEVAKTGYTAARPAPPAPEHDEHDAHTDHGHDHGHGHGHGHGGHDHGTLDEIRPRLIGAVILSVPVILMAMIPPLQFTNWQWAS